MHLQKGHVGQRGPGCVCTAAQLALAVGGRIVRGPSDAPLQGVSTDSRSVSAGSAFFALVGARFDAHEFVGDALRAEPGAIVVDRVDAGWPVPKQCAVVLVTDTTLALRDLAAWHRRNLSVWSLSITGSCGKSTVKTFSAALLGACGPTTAPPESFNNRIGVSLTLLSAGPADRFLVTELGANHPGEIDELAAMARPHVGVLTLIGEAHLEGFGSVVGVREAKGEMLKHISPRGTLVINGENAQCRILAERFRGRVATFGFGREMDYHPKHIELEGEKTSFRLRGRPVRLRTPGRFNVLNALAAIAACEAMGQDPMDVVEVLEAVVPPPLRSRVSRVGDISFILDCYNNNATAMMSAVTLFEAVGAHGRRIVVCGDMLELGPQSARIHRRVGGELARSGIDDLIAFGRYGRDMADGFARKASKRKRCFAFQPEQLTQLCAQLLKVLEPGCCVLIKGSRSMRMERVFESVRSSLDTAGPAETEAA